MPTCVSQKTHILSLFQMIKFPMILRTSLHTCGARCEQICRRTTKSVRSQRQDTCVQLFASAFLSCASAWIWFDTAPSIGNSARATPAVRQRRGHALIPFFDSQCLCLLHQSGNEHNSEILEICHYARLWLFMAPGAVKRHRE